MARLGLNIDHVATLRQARRTYEPDPVWAAVEAQLAGVECITIHLREDRRHINDDDLARLTEVVQVKLNLEMAATDEMLDIAARTQPDMSTLVPEGRQEVTTEGGLDVKGQLRRMKDVVAQLKQAGISPSAFIDDKPEQIEAAAEAGFEWCEIHTGPYANTYYKYRGDLQNKDLSEKLSRLQKASDIIISAGMRFNAGHGLNYTNILPVAAINGLEELHIGHSIISRAVFTGIKQAVGEMHQLLLQALQD